MSGRHLSWDGCANVRDLGGLETATGGTTRHKVVVRADNIRRLSTAGWDDAVAYGVRSVVDLRFPDEQRGEPKLHEALRALHVPLFGNHNPTSSHGHRRAEELRGAADVAEVVALDYVDWLESHRGQFAAAVDAIAGAEDTVVVHCYAGKDRTGLVCALLLELAGATEEAIVNDYALSEANMEALFASWIASAPDEGERTIRMRLGLAPAAAMSAVLRWLSGQGGARAYLVDAGVAPRRLDALHARLA